MAVLKLLKTMAALAMRSRKQNVTQIPTRTTGTGRSVGLSEKCQGTTTAVERLTSNDSSRRSSLGSRRAVMQPTLYGSIRPNQNPVGLLADRLSHRATFPAATDSLLPATRPELCH
jgi:hypothetical protein